VEAGNRPASDPAAAPSPYAVGWRPPSYRDSTSTSEKMVKRRDAIAGAAVLALLTLLEKEVDEMKEYVVDGIKLEDEELDMAKESIAIFCASSPAGSAPDPEQAADKAKIAVRALRKLRKS
jgi:hypothetical protein